MKYFCQKKSNEILKYMNKVTWSLFIYKGEIADTTFSSSLKREAVSCSRNISERANTEKMCPRVAEE